MTALVKIEVGLGCQGMTAVIVCLRGEYERLAAMNAASIWDGSIGYAE